MLYKMALNQSLTDGVNGSLNPGQQKVAVPYFESSTFLAETQAMNLLTIPRDIF